MWLAAATLCLISTIIANAQITCRTEENAPVDWFIIYKFPQKSGFPQGYAYIDENSKEWKKSDWKINSPNSSLIQTVNQLASSEVKALLLYNDQSPINPSSGGRAHAKGIVAFDDKFGIWVVHSIPKYPFLNTSKIAHEELHFGQMAMCMSLNISELNGIGLQLLTMRPLIYKQYIDREMLPFLNDNVRTLWSRKPNYIRRPPWNRTRPIETRGGLRVLSFSKHAKFGEELYSDWIAPTLAVPLDVQTWRRGSGKPLPSTSCKAMFPVLNVHDIKVLNSSWEYLDDHSKWAVSSMEDGPWACVGDINRMLSQEKRGGGAVCFRSFSVRKMFMTAVSDTEGCVK